MQGMRIVLWKGRLWGKVSDSDYESLLGASTNGELHEVRADRRTWKTRDHTLGGPMGGSRWPISGELKVSPPSTSRHFETWPGPAGDEIDRGVALLWLS